MERQNQDGYAVRHKAGKYENLVQTCTRCGEVMTDNRNAAWPVGQPEPQGWPAGSEVVTEKWPGMTSYHVADMKTDVTPPCTAEGYQ